MAALRLSQVVLAPIHQARHMLDLIFVAGMAVDLDIIDVVGPWSKHFIVKAPLSSPHLPCLGDELIYISLWILIKLNGYPEVLQDPSPFGGLFDELVEDWNSCLSEAINVIAP